MSNQECKRNKVKKLIGVIAVSIFTFQEAATILHAEEANATQAQTAETVSKDAGTVSRNDREAYREEHRAKRQERLEKWLENHPKIKERADRNGDGTVSKQELRRAAHLRQLQQNRNHYRRDYDNNPPGLLGGPGTNWENQPGPEGGPGASPDRQWYSQRDRDNNPPGRVGGRGTNWENRPGPRGGPGTSPNRRRGGFGGGPRQGR